AKLLPRFGWKPYVVTVDRNYLYNEDPTLLDDLPPEVEIHAARYVEPSPRGVRMALGGADRSFAALKRRGALDAARPTAASNPGQGGADRLRAYVRGRWLQAP